MLSEPPRPAIVRQKSCARIACSGTENGASANELRLVSLPRQVLHSPNIAAVIRNPMPETGWTLRRIFGTHGTDYAVCSFLHCVQDQLPLRRQRIPYKINTLAHLLRLSNVSSFHPHDLHPRKTGRQLKSLRMQRLFREVPSRIHQAPHRVNASAVESIT